MENENAQSRSNGAIRVLIFCMLAILLSGCGTVSTRLMGKSELPRFVGHAPYPAGGSDWTAVEEWKKENLGTCL